MIKLIEGNTYIIDTSELLYTYTNINTLPISSKLELTLILKYEESESSRSLYHILSPKRDYTYTKCKLLSNLEDLYSGNQKRITGSGNFCNTYLKRLSSGEGLIWIDNRIMIGKGQLISLQLKLF